MTVKACVKCLGKKVVRHYRDKTAKVDYFPLVIDWVCEDCGYKGIPIVFCNEEDYVSFVAVQEKNNERAPPGQEKENESTAEPD